MIQFLGWLSTILVLGGYIFNAKEKLLLALIVWILGDIGWIVYDILINNYSHMTLSSIIIVINIYGIYNKMRNQK